LVITQFVDNPWPDEEAYEKRRKRCRRRPKGDIL